MTIKGFIFIKKNRKDVKHSCFAYTFGVKIKRSFLLICHSYINPLLYTFPNLNPLHLSLIFFPRLTSICLTLCLPPFFFHHSHRPIRAFLSPDLYIHLSVLSLCQQFLLNIYNKTQKEVIKAVLFPLCSLKYP